MGIDVGEFENGCEGAFWLDDKAYELLSKQLKRYRELMEDPKSNCVERAAAFKEAAEPAPLWQRICGLDPALANHFLPSERRQGLRRLVRAVERMYRAELRLKGASRQGDAGDANVPPDANISTPAPVADALVPGASRISELVEPEVRTMEQFDLEGTHFRDGTRSYAGRSNLFDPLPEICAYLGIAQRKLSELCRQQTGLRIHEVGDCIRTEKLKARMRERFQALSQEWLATQEEKGSKDLSRDWRGAAWQFVRWVRGRGRGESRRKLAWELGVATPARLGRATFVCLGETIEELEVNVAMAVLQEEVGGPRVRIFGGENDEHGARLSDVIRDEEDEIDKEGNGGEGEDEVA